MFKKISKYIFLTLALVISIGFAKPGHAFVRDNAFLNASGDERVAEIKRFQARNNLVVNGKLDKRTQDMLYNPELAAYDLVSKAPSQGRWIVINKTKKILTLYNGNKVEGKFPITMGSQATPTPSAKSKISNTAINPAWGGMGGKYKPRSANDPLNPLGERWMGLHIPGKSGYGIHGTIRPREIGMSVSNGCIRMFNYDIETYVYPKMKSSDPVWIGTDQELNVWGVHQYVDLRSQNPIVADVKINDPKKEPAPAPAPVLKPARISINGQIVQTDTNPIIENSRTLVPLRLVSEHLGYQVNWNAGNQTVEILKKAKSQDGLYNTEDVLVLQIGSSVAYRLDPTYYESLSFDFRKSDEFVSTIKSSSTSISMDVGPKIVNDRTMVPIRFIAEEFGLHVDWDTSNRIVLISE